MSPRDLVMPLLTGLVVTMFALMFVGGLPASSTGGGAPVLLLFYGVVFLTVTAVVYRKRGESGDGSEGRSIWDAIPSWQYTGRHVESGGITVDGQERALEEIQEQAEERRDA